MGFGILGFVAICGAFSAARIFRMRRYMRRENDWMSARESGRARHARGSLDVEADGGVPRRRDDVPPASDTHDA